MDKYSIDSRILPRINGGEKARQDASNIVSCLGYKNVSLSCFGDTIHIFNFYILLEIINFFRFIKIKNSIVFLQSPFSLGILNHGVLNLLSKKNKIIILSHDLNFIRAGRKPFRYEVKNLNKASCVISLNKKYTNLLRKIGVRVPIVELDVWDYLLPQRKIPSHKYSTVVSFVGNLAKSEFFPDWLRLTRHYSIELIGNCSCEQKKDLQNEEKYTYRGIFDSESVPFQITGSFGLVWDGSSIESCDNGGSWGQYLKFNTPHKLSLYISAGIPVFIWDQAAAADFVRENGIGITIKSLHEIDSIMGALDEISYVAMTKRVRLLREKIIKGEFLRKAIREAEEITKKVERL